MKYLIGLTTEQINSISFVFLDKITQITGKQAIIYSDSYNAINTFSEELAQKYPLWLAEYDSTNINSGNWNNWLGLQYSDTGKINGINSNSVDLDYYKKEIFLDSTEKIQTPSYTNNKIINYTVQPGNTLSEIALKFDTTVNSIAGLNNIKNPNLIFINQILKIDISLSNSKLTEDSYELKHIIYTVKYRKYFNSNCK